MDSKEQGQRPRRAGYAERQQARFEQRVRTWEERLSSPPPPRHLHRTIITVAMMLMMLGLLYLLVFQSA